jgi:predicted O-linked N-acetylglucosamine transferase (SPINDLY family)
MTENPDLLTLGQRCHQAGDVQRAAQLYRQVLQTEPAHAQGWYLLGLACRALGHLEEARASFQRARELRPEHAETHNQLGVVLAQQGQLDPAAACFRQSLRLEPAKAVAHNNLGNVLKEQGRLDQALPCYQEAIRLQPGSALAHCNLGNLLREMGRLNEAAASGQQAVGLQPTQAVVHHNLGCTLQLQGKLDEAAASFRQALHCQPRHAGAHNGLGVVLAQQNKLDEAVATLQEALWLQPGDAGTHNNLGLTLLGLGHLSEAQACFREALRLDPANAGAHGNLLFCLSHDPDVSPGRLFAEHERWGQLHGAAPAPPRHDNYPSPERRLRVGYVSPDLRHHAIARFFEPILAHHDPARVEVLCYAEVLRPDATTARLRALADGWRSTCGLTDAQVAEQVRADRIDLLVDLAGHTAGNRLRAFAGKPAPVQVAYLGYPGTTGSPALDYRLTDAVLEPPEEPALSSEELVRLDCGKYCFAPPAEAPEVAPPPVLRQGHVTFGSFHRLSKLNGNVLDRWSQILRALPGARLLVLRDTLAGRARDELQRQFQERGVGAEQLDLRPPAQAREYLAAFAEIDLFLDPFPYTGATISCEALWMGVPFTTLRGDRPAGRVGATLLTRVGLPELIADTPDRLVKLTVELAHDLPRLTALRADLRPRMRATLCNGSAFTRSLEEVYRELWRRWCTRATAPRRGHPCADPSPLSLRGPA